MKKIIFAVFMFMILFNIPVNAEESLIDGQMDSLNMGNIYGTIDQSESIKGFSEDFNFETAVKNIASGSNTFNPRTIIGKILKSFANEVFLNIDIILTLIVLSIICAIISNLQSSFETKSVAEIAFLACYILFVGLLVYGFYECVNMARDVISDQVLFLKAAVPTYIGLMMSTGGATTAASLQPVFLYFVQLIGSFMEKIMLPTLMWISILNMVNNISDKFHVTRIIQFVKQLMTWMLGILMTLFVGILGISGFATTAIDGIGIKTLKFATSNLIPVVGGLLSDSINTVLASTQVLKNAVGVGGIIVMVLICIIPLIKLWALIAMYKLTAGVIEPLSDKRIVTLISDTASSITFLSLIVISVTIMFILSITVVIGFSNMIAQG